MISFTVNFLKDFKKSEASESQRSLALPLNET